MHFWIGKGNLPQRYRSRPVSWSFSSSPPSRRPSTRPGSPKALDSASAQRPPVPPTEADGNATNQNEVRAATTTVELSDSSAVTLGNSTTSSVDLSPRDSVTRIVGSEAQMRGLTMRIKFCIWSSVLIVALIVIPMSSPEYRYELTGTLVVVIVLFFVCCSVTMNRKFFSTPTHATRSSITIYDPNSPGGHLLVNASNGNIRVSEDSSEFSRGGSTVYVVIPTEDEENPHTQVQFSSRGQTVANLVIEHRGDHVGTQTDISSPGRTLPRRLPRHYHHHRRRYPHLVRPQDPPPYHVAVLLPSPLHMRGEGPSDDKSIDRPTESDPHPDPQGSSTAEEAGRASVTPPPSYDAVEHRS